MTAMVNLFELVTAAPGGGEERLLLADHPLRPFAAADPDRSNARVLNRVLDAPAWGGDLYADPARMTGTISAGSLKLSNADGALSYLAGHSWISLIWRRGSPGAAFGDWQTVAVARPQPPQWAVSSADPATLTITLYDLRDDLADEVQTNLLAGDAVGNVGLGGPPDLKDRPVPLALGDLASGNVTPPLANQGRQIWRLADPAAGAIATIYNVYYRGGDAGLSDLGDLGAGLEAASLTAGQRARDMTRCLLRAGGNVSGELTVDLAGPAAAGTTAPSIIQWLLQRRYGSGVALGPGFAAGLSTAAVGLWLDEAASYRDLIDRLCRSAGLWCAPDATGVWQLGRYDPPAAPLASIGVNDIVQLEGDEVDPPAWSVAVKWGRNYTPLGRGSIAEAVIGTAREAWLAQEWRTETASDVGVKARYLNARKVEVETDLRGQADAAALAGRLLGLLSLRSDGSPRRGYRVAVPMDKWRGYPLGSTLRLAWPAEGIDEPLLLVGQRYCSPEPHLMWARLWG
ncbi:MAG TPA: hypothetical protein PKZ97_12790 [Azospirillaceae bacterium]|nr:hypothetical protein [Azospirillaceae bacterium]